MTSRLNDAIWDVCESAIRDGVDPREIVQTMDSAWTEVLSEKINRDAKTFATLLKEVK